MGTLEEAIVAYFRPYSRLDSVSRCRVAKFTRLCATVCGAFDCNTGSNYCPEGVARRSYNFPRVGGCTFFLFLLQYKSHACFLSFSLSFFCFRRSRASPFFSYSAFHRSHRKIRAANNRGSQVPNGARPCYHPRFNFQFTVTSCVFIVVFYLYCVS